jgi:hypothetical protein
MQTVRDYDEIRTSYDASGKRLRLGHDRSRASNLLRLVDYVAQSGQKPDIDKLAAFVQIYAWISRNRAALVACGGARHSPGGAIGIFDFRTTCLWSLFEAFRIEDWHDPDLEVVIEVAQLLAARDEKASGDPGH